MESHQFKLSAFLFLDELSANNNRAWFKENKLRYESDVREPSLAFIRAFAPRLKKISPYFTAEDRRVGGSLMRIYRDARFTRGQDPLKTNIGIQFRHEMGRDIHAPGFYVHIAPDECFLGVGTWRPDRASLKLIREAIVDQPDQWRRATRGKRFRDRFELSGDSLKRSPRDFPADHPLVEDLRRTDFIGLRMLKEKDVLDAQFIDRVAASFTAARPLMRFLCEALNVPF